MADVAKMKHRACVSTAIEKLAKAVYPDIDFFVTAGNAETLEAFKTQKCRAVLTDQTVLQQWQSEGSECTLLPVRPLWHPSVCVSCQRLGTAR